MSIGDLAVAVRADVNAGAVEQAIRRAAMFREGYLKAGRQARSRVVAGEPATTGDARWDCFLAALVEDACLAGGDLAPDWVFDPGRFMSEWWFVSRLRGLHASAFVESPAAFANHGVFIHRSSLRNV